MKRRYALAVASAVLLCVAIVSAAGAQSSPQRRALLIGIGDYANHPDLPGPPRDVALLRTALIERFGFQAGDIQTLLDGQASAAGIGRAFEQLADVAPGSVVVVHFSGYGSQLPDNGTEELDGLDETLVPADAGPDGAGEIRDEDFDRMLKPIVAKTDRLSVILDTCYVSESSRGGAAGRCLQRASSSRLQGTPSANRKIKGPDVAREHRYDRLNAALPHQIANETVLGSGPYGAFTYELATALLNTSGTPTIQAIQQRVLARVRTRFPTQEPEFLLRDAAVAAPMFRVIDTGAPNRPAGTAVEEPAKISVWFETGQTGARAQLTKLKQRLASEPDVTVVDDRMRAQLQVVARDDGFAILAGDLTPINFGIDNTVKLDEAIHNLARWFAVLRLANPNGPLSIKIALRRSRSAEPLVGAVRPGDVVDYSVTNISPRSVYIHVLLMSSDGTTNLALAKPVQLASGATQEQRLGTFLPDERPAVTDYIKVIAATEPLDFRPLLQYPVRSGGEKRSAKGFFGKADWTAEQVSYELRREGARVSAYAVHMDTTARSSAPGPVFGQQTLCPVKEKGQCRAGRMLSRDGTFVILDQTAARTAADDTRPGAAFEEAYRLRQQFGADRVEPLFDIALGTDLPGLEGRSSGGAENEPAAAADKMWSLKYVNAPGAWNVLRKLGRAPGREAEGVHIAHLDTGYRQHPELLYKQNGIATVLPEAGIDLVDDGDPYDTLSTSGPFPNPGHGTASGSVIVSPEGCQLPQGEAPCITGVAPGAQLIPVRVNTSVIVLNQRRLAEAIMSVVEGRVREQPRLISIAMGGPPSWALHRAVRAAERAGILIVAAAGNNVGIVVWPARFDSVISAAAINVRCTPWSGSSHGSRVDVAAPGESVWRAQVDRDQETNVIGMGTGTTFATAITTGAAALWMARHANEPEFQQLAKGPGLIAAFRRTLAATSWRPIAGDATKPKTVCADDVGWDPSQDGPGILNIERVLEYPLDAGAARAAARPESNLPLFETIYPRDTPPERVTEDYTNLFAPQRRDDIGQFEAEIMFHYATNDTVRAALDRIMAGEREAAAVVNAQRALQLTDLSGPLRERLP